MRYIMLGMYDTQAKHGPITGSGPGFDEAMAKFKRRQKEYKKVGTWRAVDAQWTHNDGSFIDPDWYIVNEVYEHG